MIALLALSLNVAVAGGAPAPCHGFHELHRADVAEGTIVRRAATWSVQVGPDGVVWRPTLHGFGAPIEPLPAGARLRVDVDGGGRHELVSTHATPPIVHRTRQHHVTFWTPALHVPPATVEALATHEVTDLRHVARPEASIHTLPAHKRAALREAFDCAHRKATGHL